MGRRFSSNAAKPSRQPVRKIALFVFAGIPIISCAVLASLEPWKRRKYRVLCEGIGRFLR